MSEATLYDPPPRTRVLPRFGDSGSAPTTSTPKPSAAVPEMNAALKALQAMLRPLTRVLLRTGVSFGTFSEIAKQIFVEVAHADFQVPERKPSIAHTSVLTGLTRKEVSRRLTRKLPAHDASRYNRAVRVITGWTTDPRFSDAEDGPRTLAFDSGSPSFIDLVRAFSGDMPARTVLEELVRVGAVRKCDDGQIKLLHRAYVPGADVSEKLGILGTDVADLIGCIDHNLTAMHGRAFFQRKVSYEHLAASALPSLRGEVAERAQALLEEIQVLMQASRTDGSTEVGAGGHARAMVGIYYYEAQGQDPKA